MLHWNVDIARKEWNKQRSLGEEYFSAIKNFRWQNNTGGAVKRVCSNTGGPLTDQQSYASAFIPCHHPGDYSSQAHKHTLGVPGRGLIATNNIVGCKPDWMRLSNFIYI